MKYILAAVSAAAAAFLLLSPEEAAEAVRGAVENCLEVIIPSLFAFTVLSVFLTKSGLHRIVLRPLTFPLSKLLRTDEEICGIFLLSNMGGYPVGAKLVSEMLDGGRISRETAARMMCFCYGSGPSFIIGIAGVRVFGSAAAGLALYAACFLGSLVNFVIVRSRGGLTISPAKKNSDLTAECFISSVISAAKVMFTVCVMITAFSVVIAMLAHIRADEAFAALMKLTGAGELSDKIFPALMEVSRLGDMPPAVGAFPLCAGLLSFGGACVVLQIAATARDIPLGKFLLFRIPAAAVSVAAAIPLSMIITPADTAVIAAARTEVFSSNVPASLCIFAMAGILLAGEKRSARMAGDDQINVHK